MMIFSAAHRTVAYFAIYLCIMSASEDVFDFVLEEPEAARDAGLDSPFALSSSSSPVLEDAPASDHAEPADVFDLIFLTLYFNLKRTRYLLQDPLLPPLSMSSTSS